MFRVRLGLGLKVRVRVYWWCRLRDFLLLLYSSVVWKYTDPVNYNRPLTISASLIQAVLDTVARYKFNWCMHCMYCIITCLSSIFALLTTNFCCRTKTFPSRCRCSTRCCDVYTQRDDVTVLWWVCTMWWRQWSVTCTHNLMTTSRRLYDVYTQRDDVTVLRRVRTIWWRQRFCDVCTIWWRRLCDVYTRYDDVTVLWRVRTIWWRQRSVTYAHNAMTTTVTWTPSVTSPQNVDLETRIQKKQPTLDVVRNNKMRSNGSKC